VIGSRSDDQGVGLYVQPLWLQGGVQGGRYSGKKKPEWHLQRGEHGTHGVKAKKRKGPFRGKIQ